MACNPSLLLCDEATSALDPETTLSILELLRGINRKFGLSIVLITHEMNVVRQIAEQTLVLAGGRIVEDGPTTEIFRNPRSPEALLMLQAAGLAPEDAKCQACRITICSTVFCRLCRWSGWRADFPRRQVCRWRCCWC